MINPFTCSDFNAPSSSDLLSAEAKPDIIQAISQEYYTEETTMSFYLIMDIFILAYGLLLAFRPSFWWKRTNRNRGQTPPDSYLRNTRITGIVFAAIGAVLLVLLLL